MGPKGVAIQSFTKSPPRVLHILVRPLILEHLHKGLSTTTTANQIVESSNKFITGNTPALTILFKMLREDGRPLPVGSFTERSVARRVYNSTGVAVE